MGTIILLTLQDREGTNIFCTYQELVFESHGLG